MRRTFNTTADDETALSGLGLDFDAVVRRHLDVIQSNYVDAKRAEVENSSRNRPLSDRLAAVDAAKAKLDEMR